MPNKVAFSLAVVLIGLGFADVFLNEGETLTYLTRKFAELIEYLAFWR
jgi:hypothetical protein